MLNVHRCPLLAEGLPSATYFIDTLIKFVRSVGRRGSKLFPMMCYTRSNSIKQFYSLANLLHLVISLVRSKFLFLFLHSFLLATFQWQGGAFRFLKPLKQFTNGICRNLKDWVNNKLVDGAVFS